MGSPVKITAFCQPNAAIPFYVLMESKTADAFNENIDHPPEQDGGYLLFSVRPGIGLKVDESKVAKFLHQPKRIVGNFHADSSVAH